MSKRGGESPVNMNNSLRKKLNLSGKDNKSDNSLFR